MPYNDLTLLDAAQEVASIANRTSPQTVSQRDFDNARARSLFYPDLPRAKRIAERLDMKWHEVLAAAHTDDKKQAVRIAAKKREPDGDWVTPENAASALAVIALRLGTKSPTRDEYTHERAKMLAADAKRYMHGGQLRVPTDAQAIHALGSWDAALRAAGLQTERPPSKPKPPKHWTRDRCIAAVADYLREARQDTTRHTTHAGYLDWAKQQEIAPSSVTIRKYGGWSFIQHEAQELLLAQELGIVPRT